MVQSTSPLRQQYVAGKGFRISIVESIDFGYLFFDGLLIWYLQVDSTLNFLSSFMLVNGSPANHHPKMLPLHTLC